MLRIAGQYDATPVPCPRCLGARTVPAPVRWDAYERFTPEVGAPIPCPKCRGAGTVPAVEAAALQTETMRTREILALIGAGRRTLDEVQLALEARHADADLDLTMGIVAELARADLIWLENPQEPECMKHRWRLSPKGRLAAREEQRDG